MGVGDKGVGNLEKLGRPAVPQLAHIKKKGPPFPENLDKKRRIFDRVIDELGPKKRFQDFPFEISLILRTMTS
jgi:hypothetical protein